MRAYRFEASNTMWAQEVVKCKWRSLRRNLTKWTPSLLPHGVFALRPRIQAWPTPKFSSFMSPLEKLDLGTLPVYRWGVEATVHAKQARTNCVWDKRVQTRKCTAGAFNRPSCSSQNTAAWGRCWSWIASQMVFNRIKKKKNISIWTVYGFNVRCAQHQNRVTHIKRWRQCQK